jgi:hypothetical protein
VDHDPTYDPPPPPHAILLEGEIRDVATLRAEPAAVIEAWTDEPGYTPEANVDPQGRFTLRIDVCRKAFTPGEQLALGVAEAVLIGTSDPDTCARRLWSYRFRARLGDRCSITHAPESVALERRPLVLWLEPCAALEARTWRPRPAR